MNILIITYIALIKGLYTRGISRDTALKENMMKPFPIQLTNIILRCMFKNGCIQSFLSHEVDGLKTIRFENSGCCTEAFGTLICKMVPFNSSKLKEMDKGVKNEEEERKYCDAPEIIPVIVFQTPNDTDIVTSMANSKSVDLLPERTNQMSFGHLRLSPCEPRLWRGQTTTSNIGHRYVKTNDAYHGNIFGMSPLSKALQRKIDMQFVLAFQCDWPDSPEKWVDRHRQSGFPEEQTVKSIVQTGCHIIPLTPCTRLLDIYDDPVQFMTIDDHTWCYSFAAAEKELSCYLSSEQMQSFLLFQSLVDIALKGILLPPAIVKSVFFYACENITFSYWKSDPVGCIFLLLKKFALCLKNRRVPHYFMSEKNLLDHVPEKITVESYKKLECVRMQPFVSLYILLEEYTTVLLTKGIVVEEIIESMSYNAHYDTRTSSPSENSFQVNSMFFEDLVYERNYQFASVVIQDMIEEKGNSLHEDSGVKMAVHILSGIPVGLSWCSALYIDIQHKTKLTVELCKGQNCICLSEVFGPDCIADLPDAKVPERFSICNGDLQFALDASDLLTKVVNTTTYIHCLKYYLKRYGEMAGDSLILTDLEARMAKCDLTHRQHMGYNVTKSVMTLTHLHLLYVNLFNACHKYLTVEEFREMMPTFILIAEGLGTEVPIQNIRNIQHALDESEKKSRF